MNQIYPTDLTDEEWSLLSPFFFPAQPVLRAGPKETPERTLLTLNVLRYLNKTGCQWRMLPGEFPPRSTVHDAFTRWTASGLWPRINTALREKARLTVKKTLCQASPSSRVKASSAPIP